MNTPAHDMSPPPDSEAPARSAEAAPPPQPAPVPRDVGLALSGGGIRAAIFHLGVLRYLAEVGILDHVGCLSTVSGATLLAGLLFSQNKGQWPQSTNFKDVHARVKDLLLSHNLQLRCLVHGLAMPWNWPRLPHRGGILADAIRSAWGITEPLATLPETPTWSIDATLMETGKRWRFRRDNLAPGAPVRFLMGESTVGYAEADNFPLAKAMATSAAFPGGFSPLLIATAGTTWRLPNYAQPTKGPVEVTPQFAHYHLADGGVYDNLGLETLFDASTAAIRRSSGCSYLIVSDAGKPFKTEAWGGFSQFVGFSKRTFDIMDNQVRNLRVRELVGSFVRQQSAGLMLRISESAADAVKSAIQHHNSRAGNIKLPEYLPPDRVKDAAFYKTTLSRPMPADFDLIEAHGYQVAQVQDLLWGSYPANSAAPSPASAMPPPSKGATPTPTP